MGQERRLRIARVDNDIGHWLANVRAQQGLTQSELARRCETAQNAISRMENGRASPTLTTLAKLFDGMGLTLYLGTDDG